ncbi:MAG: LLM class flavin-dependent oxidoreductase, partial [Acidimicrobiaceae bacterium]|nr:LLM class flavin-dependent oxidoreductase [Acidimicrobiaceae bacterium]
MDSVAPMRLGITLWADRDVAGLARLAACAERTGFDDVWWPDHYMHRDVGATLTACALATDRVRLGTAVTSPLLRHPGALASLFASLAEIAPGRIVAGIGPGGWELPTQLGIHEPRPLTVTRETALLLADLLSGRSATAPA